MKYIKHKQIFDLLSNFDITPLSNHDPIFENSEESIKKGDFFHLYAPFEAFKKLQELGLIKTNNKFRKVLEYDEKIDHPANEIIYEWMDKHKGYYAGGVIIFFEEEIFLSLDTIGATKKHRELETEKNKSLFEETFSKYKPAAYDWEEPVCEFGCEYYFVKK